MTLPVVSAPPAAPPAARHARAAAAGAAEPGAFEAMLATTADTNGLDRIVADAGAPESGESVAAGDDERPADPALDMWTAAWMGAPRAPEEAAAPAATPGDVAASVRETPAPREGNESDAVVDLDRVAGPQPADVDVPAGLQPDARTGATVATTAASSAAVDQGTNAPRDPSNQVTKASMPAPPAHASSAPTADGAADAAATPTGRASATPHEVPQVRPEGSRSRVSEDAVKSAVRSVLAEALAGRGGRAAHPPAEVARESAVPPVATAALPPVLPTPPAAPVRTSPMPVDQAPADGVGRLTVPGNDAPAIDAGGRSGAERRGHADEHAGDAWKRSSGQDRLASLPASMVFPGQVGFGAALDHAAPPAGWVAPTATPYVPASVGPQIVRAVHVQVAQGGGEMTLTLSPEHLGTVTLEVKVEQQRVVATLTAETPAVRGWVAAHEQDLKSGLADLGLQLDELVVKDEERRRDDPKERPAPDRRRQAKPDEEGEFEIPV